MKAHKYQVITYGSILDWTHEMGEKQYKLYIPGQGVLAYRDNKQIDYFSEDNNVIAEAEQAIKGALNIEEEAKWLGKEGAKYLGEIELPDDVVSKVVSAGKSLNQARTTFQESARTLVELI